MIAKRTAELPETVEVTNAEGERFDLYGMQDEWYQDIIADDLPTLLHEGAIWTTSSGDCSWSLSGRELFVLASRADISGYVSQPCLALGREHVVMCRAAIAGGVEAAIRATGADPSTTADERLGAPPGWIVYLKVIPTVSVPPVEGPDLLNALRPLPEIEISLEGGVPVEFTNWIQGHPPTIRVYGDPEHTAEVFIDGHLARCGDYGEYRAPGWDAVGPHSVACAGTTKTYSIVPFEGDWSWWEAYSFPANRRTNWRLSICGPVVRATGQEHAAESNTVVVPETNPVLVGCAPHEHTIATQASTIIGARCLATPDFIPVWAVPSSPLHSNKATARVLLLVHRAPRRFSADAVLALCRKRDARIDCWCQAILDASRKGLRIKPDTESTRALWCLYTRLARRIWRSRR